MSQTACAHAVPHHLSQEELREMLLRARSRCEAEGQRWTAARERTYELMLQAGAPVKAYQLMELFQHGRSAKPPTIYRALEFLEQHGLVHRIASLNAFIACAIDEAPHAAAFLICDCCGAAEEFEPGKVTTAVAAAAQHGFKARTVALEVRGLCEDCAR